jgi:hypothetical protein
MELRSLDFRGGGFCGRGSGGRSSLEKIELGEKGVFFWVLFVLRGRRKEEGGRRKEEGGRRKEEGGRRKEEGGRRKEEGGRRKEERGRRKEGG